MAYLEAVKRANHPLELSRQTARRVRTRSDQARSSKRGERTFESQALTKKPKTMVQTKAPMNPSHVLLGDSRRNGVLTNLRPKSLPQKNAKQSLQITSDTGNTNQKRPDAQSQGVFQRSQHQRLSSHTG
jgi:hypothetical protein